jgi:hypothetical protein
MVGCLSEQSEVRAALVQTLAPLITALRAFVAPAPPDSPATPDSDAMPP